MEPVESVESKELMDRIQEDLASHDVRTLENALGELQFVTIPRGSPYALPLMRSVLELVDREVLCDSGYVMSALGQVCEGLENPEIIECMDRVMSMDRVLDSPYDRYNLLGYLLESIEPTDSAAAHIIPRIRLIGPLIGEFSQETVGTIEMVIERFHQVFSSRQIDELLAYLLTPEAMNDPPGWGDIVDFNFSGFDDGTPAFRAFRAVSKLMPHLSSANWKTIGNCFFQLNYTPVELVPLLYDKQSPQGVDVDALILACYEVASDFRHINGASYGALRVLMRRQTEMDDRLLAKITTLIIGNLEAELPARNHHIKGYLRVRDASAALVDEVLRLQTGSLWNAPLLYALFDTFRVGAQIDFGPGEEFYAQHFDTFRVGAQIEFGPAAKELCALRLYTFHVGAQIYFGAVEEFRALLKFPAWPRELLRQHISAIVPVVFVSFHYDKVTHEFWTRLCREYPAPEMELLDALSELVETGVVFFDLVGLYGSWEVIETILSSRAYEAASPGPDSLFWQRLRVGIEPFLDSDDPQIRSKASAILAQSSS